MEPSDIRRWVENHRAAARREEAERRGRPLPPGQAFRWAMELLRIHEALHGSPFGRRDPVAEREDAQAREAWARLRERWR
ncbi:MAG TPA: hypothetical protein VNA04_06170 [Thermoanaerobaculia bacterium]|nr:hypothetical protein [Thermoanaerobaculia bacterium]